MASQERTKSNGVKGTKFTYSLGVEFWKKDPRPFSKYVLNPNVLATFSCSPTESKVSKTFDGLDFMVKHIHKSAKKKRGDKLGGIKKIEASKIGRVFYFYTYSQGEQDYDVLRFFS